MGEALFEVGAVDVLEGPEEPELISNDGAAQCPDSAVLVVDPYFLSLEGCALCVVRLEVLVGDVEADVPAEFVAAGLGDDVHDSASGSPMFRLQAAHLHGDLLDNVDTEVTANTPTPGVGALHPVQVD